MSLLVSIVTILMSGVVAAVVTYNLNRHQRREELFLTKAEETLRHFVAFNNTVRSIFSVMEVYRQGTMSYDQALSRVNQAMDIYSNSDHSTTINALTLYFPSARPIWAQLIQTLQFDLPKNPQEVPKIDKNYYDLQTLFEVEVARQAHNIPTPWSSVLKKFAKSLTGSS